MLRDREWNGKGGITCQNFDSHQTDTTDFHVPPPYPRVASSFFPRAAVPSLKSRDVFVSSPRFPGKVITHRRAALDGRELSCSQT